MANWHSKVCSNGPKVKDIDALTSVLEKWTFREDADGEAVVAEIDGGHLDIYGEAQLEPIPKASMEFFNSLSNDQKARVSTYAEDGSHGATVEALRAFLDSEWDGDVLGFLSDVQPYLAEELIIQQIGSMKCVYEFSAIEWEVTAGDGPILLHELGPPPKIWVNGERNANEEVAYLHRLIQQYDTTDAAVCDNCGKVWHIDALVHPKNIMQRMDAGIGVVPGGECPECGALAYVTMKFRASETE